MIESVATAVADFDSFCASADAPMIGAVVSTTGDLSSATASGVSDLAVDGAIEEVEPIEGMAPIDGVNGGAESVATTASGVAPLGFELIGAVDAALSPAAFGSGGIAGNSTSGEAVLATGEESAVVPDGAAEAFVASFIAAGPGDQLGASPPAAGAVAAPGVDTVVGVNGGGASAA